MLNAERVAVSGENVLHLKIKGLILDTVHHLSVVDELIDARVSSVDDWEWQKRIRFELTRVVSEMNGYYQPPLYS